MTAVSVSILQNNLVSSKELTTIVVRTCRGTQSDEYILSTADKAGFSERQVYFGILGTFAKLSRGSQPLVVHINQILSKMRTCKNLKATALGASTSTANARNSVFKSTNSAQPAHPLLRLSKKQLLGLLESEATEATSRDAFYPLAASAFLEWCHCEERGNYCPTVRDNRLVSKLSAIRTAFAPASYTHPKNIQL